MHGDLQQYMNDVINKLKSEMGPKLEGNGPKKSLLDESTIMQKGTEDSSVFGESASDTE